MEWRWNTSKVTDMSYLFGMCRYLKKIDLSNWNVKNVTGMQGMFTNATNLTTIYANSNWQTTATKLTDSSYMFASSEKLVGAVSYNSSNIDISMANSDTGYFTRKS